METLEFYKIAEKEKINIKVLDFETLNGLYYQNSIYLNRKILNTKKERLVLAEELGHYFTGVTPTLPFSTDYYSKLIRSKNEFKAKKWLINEVIPFNTLKRFLGQNMSFYDIAEELNVTVQLVIDACRLYNFIF